MSGPRGPVEALATEGLAKRYGDVSALADFSLSVRRGEIVGLVGANGAGKTTFVEVVTGLVRPDAGTVRVLGEDMLRAPRQARRHLGFAPQEVALYFSATVRENLDLFAGLVGLRGPAMRVAIDSVVAAMRLEDLLARPTAVLSGGQRRRTQIATALLGTPSLLLLDEPTAGADPPTREALLKVVRDRAAAGAGIVYTTHYLPELTELDATLAVVRGGRVIARGDQDVLLNGLLGEVRVQVGGPLPADAAMMGRVVGDELRVATADPAQTLAELLAVGVVPLTVDVRKPSLDDLYHSLEPAVAHAI